LLKNENVLQQDAEIKETTEKYGLEAGLFKVRDVQHLAPFLLQCPLPACNICQECQECTPPKS
jgi:hypothetical protein